MGRQETATHTALWCGTPVSLNLQPGINLILYLSQSSALTYTYSNRCFNPVLKGPCWNFKLSRRLKLVVFYCVPFSLFQLCLLRMLVHLKGCNWKLQFESVYVTALIPYTYMNSGCFKSRMVSSGMIRRVTLVRTNAAEELNASLSGWQESMN
jgi:hypothetical protein